MMGTVVVKGLKFIIRYSSFCFRKNSSTSCEIRANGMTLLSLGYTETTETIKFVSKNVKEKISYFRKIFALTNIPHPSCLFLFDIFLSFSLSKGNFGISP